MNIVIVSKTIVGVRPVPIGIDRGGNIFKGTLSGALKNNLKERLSEEKIDCNIEVDRTYDNCETMVKRGVNLILVSPYVKDKVDMDRVHKNHLYVLSEKEFNKGYVENIVEYIKNNLRSL